MNSVEIYTDGSCLKNPGPGAYSAIVFHEKSVKIISGFLADTTNNQMELSGAIKALEYISSIYEKNVTTHEKPQIKLHTDSQYVKNGIEQWIFNWHKNNWRTANGGAVKNQELWKSLYKLNLVIRPNWIWVRGHSDNLYNNVVDFVANTTARDGKKFINIDILKTKFPELSNYFINCI
jgi:ribonuclease HI